MILFAKLLFRKGAYLKMIIHVNIDMPDASSKTQVSQYTEIEFLFIELYPKNFMFYRLKID